MVVVMTTHLPADAVDTFQFQTSSIGDWLGIRIEPGTVFATLFISTRPGQFSEMGEAICLVRRLLEEFDSERLQIRLVDCHKTPANAKSANVSAIPCLIVYGSAEDTRFIGNLIDAEALIRANIEAQLEQYQTAA